MKTIYTSNFARKGADPNAYSISAWPPPWYTGKTFPILAPTRELVLAVIKGTMDINEYQKQYIELLESRIKDPIKVIDEIPDGAFLLCYEKVTDMCHRHLMRDWIYEKTGFSITEWKTPKEQRIADQQKLVDELVEF